MKNRSFSQKLSDSLSENNFIASEDKALYEFGIKYGLKWAFGIIVALVISACFHMLPYGVLFLLSFVSLRSYAGGYHAKTQLRCDIISLLVLLFMLLGIKYIILDKSIYMVITIISSIVILLLSPVEDSNRPISESETVAYRKRIKIILTLQVLLFLGSFFLNIEMIYKSIGYSLFILAVMLIMGIIKNTVESRQKP